jgi:hypothetical protein
MSVGRWPIGTSYQHEVFERHDGRRRMFDAFGPDSTEFTAVGSLAASPRSLRSALRLHRFRPGRFIIVDDQPTLLAGSG